MNALQRALAIEQQVARIIGKQSLNGVQFDKSRAAFYVFELEVRAQDLYRKIRPHLKPEVEQHGVTVWDWFKMDTGDLNNATLDWWWDMPDEVDDIVEGSYSRVTFSEPDLGKREKLIAQLLLLGWNPAEYTPVTEKGGGGNPKLTVEDPKGGKMICPSLFNIVGDVGKDIAMWYTLKHRQSQIKGFIKLVRPDGRIAAEGHTIGTPTYRFRHRGVVNVPKAASFVVFGRQMRSLFTVKGASLHERINKRGEYDELVNKIERGIYNQQGYKLVGHDASGLELRILAHYINDDKYTESIAYGDAHTANQVAAGLPTRDAAKTFIYAFIYGAGNKKIGSIIGGGVAQGRAIKERFLAANPKLATLIEGVQAAAGKGWVKGIDGRRVRIRRDKVTKRPQVHKALNALIQTGGALVMKYSMVWLDLAVTAEALNVSKVLDVHDEAQAEVTDDDAQRYAWLAEESIRVAGRYLEMRCPLDAEAKVDTRWNKTH